MDQQRASWQKVIPDHPSEVHGVAEVLLEIAEDPRGGMSENDKLNNIRSEIRGALRSFLHR